MKDITKLVENYNLVETSPINLIRESSDNEVFVIGDKNRKILRISKRLPIEDIEFEYNAVQYLKENGINVPKWLKTKNDNFYTLIDNKIVVLFDFLGGCHIKADKDHFPTPNQAYNAGKNLGLISNVASEFKSSLTRKRNILSELERAITLSDIFVEQFEGGKDFIDQVRKFIEFGKNQKEIEGFIHNDYRPSNVFLNNKDEIVGTIDFDWSCIGPIIKDLALAVVEWSFPDGVSEPNAEIFDSFLNGYNSVANHKFLKDEKLYSWIKFATLSDASTYFCDLAEDLNSTKKIIKSYMYKKFLFFSKINS